MTAVPSLIDSHCHLNYDYSPKTADDLVREAKAAGIDYLMTVGTDLKAIEPIRQISERFAEVFHTVGVHPHDAVTLEEKDLALLEAAARHPKCRAVGEIGLDYFYDHSPHAIQQERLEMQLELALKLALPVVIHARDAEKDLLDRLTPYAKKAAGIPGVIHCFTGTTPFGKACLELGFKISFSGILTFKNSEPLRESARQFPLTELLVETDSPYLAPVPYRGKKCEPSMVRATALKLAEIKGVSLEEVAAATSANARKVFRLPS